MPRTPTTRDAFDAVAWLDPPLLVNRRGVAGRSYNVWIGETPATLTMPTGGPSELHLGASRGASSTGFPSFPPPPLAGPITDGAWAYTATSLPVPRPVLIATGVRLQWRDAAHAKQIRDGTQFAGESDPLLAELGWWLSVVRDWLSAWSGNLRDRVELAPPPRVRYTLQDGTSYPVGGGPSGVPVIVKGQRASYPRELRAAFAAASAGMEVPLPHRLLAESVIYAYRNQYRHAVITACSAAEVALSESADRLLAGSGRSEAERDEILGRVSGLAELCRLNSARPKGLPVSLGRVIDQLARPRNEAAHKGREPGEDDTFNAVRTAQALLAVSPLPSPRSILSASDAR